jgi:hypothetical protein
MAPPTGLPDPATEVDKISIGSFVDCLLDF